MTTAGSRRSLATGFLERARSHPDSHALEVDGEQLTYAALWHRAGRVTAHLREHAGDQPLVAVLSPRDTTAFASILGIAAAGKGYVPLNPKFPVARLAAMLRASGCSTLIHGGSSAALAREVIAAVGSAGIVAIDESAGTLHDAADPIETGHGGDSVAYLLFTSGSTGEPKGVPITVVNVAAYLAEARLHYGLGESDRCSQMFDLTFDLSVHDMFVCWDAGATLCVVPDRQVMLPAQFIKEKRLTAWFSVPSVAASLARARLLKPGAFPSLRWSLFCGEPLTTTLAEAWQAAAPASIVENLYGPTETTIAITRFRWGAEAGPVTTGVVPIGRPYQGHSYALVADDGASGNQGELCLSGPQVASGYWRDAARTASSFTTLPGQDGLWYHTGDMARRDESGGLHYLGRVDQQVKIAGFRVELQEVENLLRSAARTELAVAVPWPVADANPSALVAVVGADAVTDDGQILRLCRETLPAYMVPKQIVRMAEVPLNANGKVDRRAIAERLRHK